MSSSPPTSPPWALIPILRASHQVVLYNPTSHALSIRERASAELKPKSNPLFCPYCERPYDTDTQNIDSHSSTEASETRAHNYFQLLAVANESSRPATPFSSTPSPEPAAIPSETMAEGYFSAFFKEEYRLGMGANGSVFLCQMIFTQVLQHVLDGNPLGRFAVKKIAVGQSHDYLLKALREVRLLETLHHRNIVPYHHSWLETYLDSAPVSRDSGQAYVSVNVKLGTTAPETGVLMQWAEGGSLDDFIRARLGVPSPQSRSRDEGPTEDEAQSRSARIRAFRSAQAHPEQSRTRRKEQRKAERGRAVHLLSAEEVKDIFNDIVSGLGFLHARAILHLDLKPGNVLLTWDEGRLIPRAMLSDFGTYQDMVSPERARTGDTGTLEYTAPESLSLTHQPSSKTDMWSLGMILHKLLFFRLPYEHVEDSDISKLEDEVRRYPGFKAASEVTAACKRRGFPRAAMILLEELLTVIPRTRPSCEQILAVLKEGKLDPLQRDHAIDEDRVSLVPIIRPRRGSTPPSPIATRADSAEKIQIRRDSDASTVAPESPSGEKTPLLSLPAPPAPLPRLMLRLIWGPIGSWFPSVHPIRIFKSAFLVIKVLSVTNLCGDASPRPLVLCLVLVLAVMDTWSDGVNVSGFLGVVHLGIIALGKDRCCVY